MNYRQLDDTIRKTLRDRPNNANEHCERRKSRRHSTGTNTYSPSSCNGTMNGSMHRKHGSTTLHSTAEDEESSGSNPGYTNGYSKSKLDTTIVVSIMLFITLLQLMVLV